MSPTKRMRLLLLATLIPLVLLVAVLIGGGGAVRARTDARKGSPRRWTPAGAYRIDVGRGARAVTIFRPANATGNEAVVLFLHGWGGIDPRSYGDWIEHLVHRRDTVIYPIYQSPPFTDTTTPARNVLVGVRAALGQLSVARGRLVVAGHSAGGALGPDYAGSAAAARLPVPAAVLSAYPGRMLRGIALPLPAVRPDRVPAATRVVVLAGDDDRVVGTATARSIAHRLRRTRVMLTIVHDDRVDDHLAPLRSDAVARRTFWAPLDRLVSGTGRR